MADRRGQGASSPGSEKLEWIGVKVGRTVELEHAVSSRGAHRRQMPRSAVGARHGGDCGLEARHARDKGLLDARSMLGQLHCCSYHCRVLIELGLQVLKR